MENTTTNNATSELIGVNNATKYVVLPDGRMARLLKPVKVKHYLYYSFINDQGKAVRINANNARTVNEIVVSKK